MVHDEEVNRKKQKEFGLHNMIDRKGSFYYIGKIMYICIGRPSVAGPARVCKKRPLPSMT